MSVSGEVTTFLTKTDYAYTALRRRILDGDLKPGVRLLLRPLADELHVSVMPVRDAIRLLERDGLVATESHRGATVTTISRKDILATIGIRMWLEVLAIREATPLHTSGSLAVAEAALEDAEHAAATGDGLAYTLANRRVHNALEAPASAEVQQLVEDLWDRVWRARRRMSLFVLAADRIGGAESEHRALYDAVRSGDAAAASAAMERHRESTLSAWADVLAEQAHSEVS